MLKVCSCIIYMLSNHWNRTAVLLTTLNSYTTVAHSLALERNCGLSFHMSLTLSQISQLVIPPRPLLLILLASEWLLLTHRSRRPFQYTSSVIWNSIPLSVMHASSLSSFKSKVKTHIFSFAYWFIIFVLMINFFPFPSSVIYQAHQQYAHNCVCMHMSAYECMYLCLCAHVCVCVCLYIFDSNKCVCLNAFVSTHAPMGWGAIIDLLYIIDREQYMWNKL